MSAIAELHIVPLDALGDLADAAEQDRFQEALGRVGRKIEGFGSSGFYMGPLAAYLGERGLPRVSDEHGQLLMRIALAEEIGLDLFPPEVREHLALLDPAAHDERALRRFVEEFEEREDEGAGEALKQALEAVHAGVSQLAPGEALLVLVLF